jgi:menaquinone-specific isochorismate synthase
LDKQHVSQTRFLVPVNATRKIEVDELDSFLGNGLFMGLGPERCLVAWGRPKKAKKPAADIPQFYLPDFYLEEKMPWVTFENVIVATRENIIEGLAGFALQPGLDILFQAPEFSEFEKSFKLIQAEIQKQNLNKAVPAVFSHCSGSMTKSMRAKYISNLLKNAIKPTPYGYLTPTEGLMGASPEILFSYDLKMNQLTTMALAGTRKTEFENESSISNDEKEMYEHELVIQGLKNKISKLGDMQVSPTYVWNLGPLVHLRTDLTLDLKDTPKPMNIFNEMCNALHPTAALGVSPMTADWRFLKSCDRDNKRGRFGAPFGVLSPTGLSNVLVAIRNIQWDENGIYMGVGCGVVAQSNLKNEWQELEIKRQSICELLGL